MALMILLADDDLGIRVAVEDYLKLAGYDVVAAENGEEALKMLDTYHPHLLISDIKMPKKDGYTLVRQLRQRPEFRLLPVIFLTEKDTTPERIQGYEVGCDLYLPKPFEMEELRAVIRNLLERSHIIKAELKFSEQEARSQSSEQVTQAVKVSLSAYLDSFHLTKREIQVLNLLTTGLSNDKIGDELYISHKTVEKHVSRLLEKTKTKNRTELVRFALDHHLLD